MPTTQGHDLTATDTDAARIKRPNRRSIIARLSALAVVLPGTSALAANAPTTKPDERINALFAPIAEAISNVVFYPIRQGNGAAMPAMVLWLIVAATCFTVHFRFINLRGFKYRRHNADGSVSGGPVHYLTKGINEHYPRMKWFGKLLAIVFAICCIGGSLGSGNMFQVNQTFQQFVAMTGGETSLLTGKGWLFGLVMALMVGLVIIGGIKSIARVTCKLVPFMAIVCVACSFWIIFANPSFAGQAFHAIVSGAFTPEAGYGGFVAC